MAIGSGRLAALDPAAQAVTFRYKDYGDKHRQKQMTLSTVEFLRRFSLHILPPRFVKIRHYGLTGNHQRAEKIVAARAALNAAEGEAGNTAGEPAESDRLDPSTGLGTAPRCCPRCGSSRLVLLRHDLPGNMPRLDSS